jgi:phosphatidylserine/phosphatidylglycerophosphate/cardiolipin synthase-like enzyme
MVRLVLNVDLHQALGEALVSCRHRLFIATADLKDVRLPAVSPRGQRARGIVTVLDELGRGGVEVRVLHGGVPSGPFLEELKRLRTLSFALRRCPRVHAKAILVDGVKMYLGSANLTGAGLGAKSPRRRNFEAGIWTDELSLIDPLADMLNTVWDGAHCPACDRKEYCPEPLEEPKKRDILNGRRHPSPQVLQHRQHV